MIYETALLLGTMAYYTNKSMKLDEQAMQKNVKACKRMAEAEYAVEMHSKMLMDKIALNARRKESILNNHIKLFMEQYSVFHQVKFEKGRGIEELEEIDQIQRAFHHQITLPSFAPGAVMSNKQLAINFALRGIGGLMVKESHLNLEAASQNLSKSRVVAAQADTMIIFMDGIGEKVQIITELLQKLGALYMLSSRELQRIVDQNGTDASKYTQEDIQAINTSMHMTKLIYRIINTPLINQNGEIEQTALQAIDEGQNYLNQLR